MPTPASWARGPQGSVSGQPSEGPGGSFLRAAETTLATVHSCMLLGVKALSPRPRSDQAAAPQGLSALLAVSSPSAGLGGRLQAGVAETVGWNGLPGRAREQPLACKEENVSIARPVGFVLLFQTVPGTGEADPAEPGPKPVPGAAGALARDRPPSGCHAAAVSLRHSPCPCSPLMAVCLPSHVHTHARIPGRSGTR